MKSRIFWLGLSLAVLVLVVGVVIVLEDEARIVETVPEPYIPPVSVVQVVSGDNSGVMVSYAQVLPRWRGAVKARVSGQVLEISKNAFAGRSVSQGDLLIRVDEAPYLVALREAEQAVLSARIELTRQQARAERARAEWEAAGIQSPPTELALNIPQLELAQRSLALEQSRLALARNKLADTRVLAPFSGIVTLRNVSIAQSISEGENLLEMVGDEHLQIALSLSRNQWTMLPDDWVDSLVRIRDADGALLGRATIRGGGGFLDPQTRQYRMFLEVNAGARVLPGDYVGVELPGRPFSHTLKIPQTALSREGLVWFVDGQNRLRKFTARVRFYSGTDIVVDAPDGPDAQAAGDDTGRSWLIVTTPLASYIAGRRVQPVLTGEG